MFDSGTPSLADIAAVTGNNANCFGGNGGWWVLILLFFLFGGWGRNGFNGGNNCGCDSACATVGDIERGFNQQSTNMRFNAVDNAFAQLGLLESPAVCKSVQRSVSARLSNAGSGERDFPSACRLLLRRRAQHRQRELQHLSRIC